VEHDLPLEAYNPAQQWTPTPPAAHVKFTLGGKSYDVESNQPTVIVQGPNITLSKTVDKTVVDPDETIRVTITAKNIGNLPSRTKIMDTLPTGAELVSGELNRPSSS